MIEHLRTTLFTRQLSNPSGFGDQSLVSSAPDTIRLLGGIPDPNVLPNDEIQAAVQRMWEKSSVMTASLQYSHSQGFEGLRTWIAHREGVEPNRIVITNGGMHGLSLSVLALVERGSTVAVDNPVYPLFLRVLELSDGRSMPIPVHRDGLDIDYLARRLESGENISAVYTVPDFHNPSQGTLSSDKRAGLVALAERHNFVVLADNPYRELRFGGKDQGHDTFNQSDHVVHINTFTKTLGPGLRLGWLVLPEHLVSAFVKIRNRQDSHSSTFVQTIVQSLLTTNPTWFDDKLDIARKLYLHRSQLLIDSLHRYLPGQFEAELPEGGLFLWPRIADDSIDTLLLHKRSLAEGVAYQPGQFFTSGPGTNSDRHIRFAYGDVSDASIVLAVERLARAFD